MGVTLHADLCGCMSAAWSAGHAKGVQKHGSFPCIDQLLVQLHVCVYGVIK